MKAKKFCGLSLSARDRRYLQSLERGGTALSGRRWRRIRTLLLLDDGKSVRETAKAVGTYPREISRVGKRYLAKGLNHALSDNERPKPKPKLDDTQQAAIVAMVCGPPPQGSSRWTVRLIAEHAVKRRIVDKVGRETIRVTLASHGLKPWRKKNVVHCENRPRIRQENGGCPSSLCEALRFKAAGGLPG